MPDPESEENNPGKGEAQSSSPQGKPLPEFSEAQIIRIEVPRDEGKLPAVSVIEGDIAKKLEAHGTQLFTEGTKEVIIMVSVQGNPIYPRDGEDQK